MSLTEKQAADLKKFKGAIIMYPQFSIAYEAILDVLKLYRRTGIQQNLVLLGESGCGKSTLLELIEKENPPYREAERTVVPILKVSVPALATVYRLIEALLVSIGDPAPMLGTASAKELRLGHLIKRCGVEVILIDELQHLRDRARVPTAYAIGDWIKSFGDATGLPMIGSGLPRARGLLDGNEQLRRRASSVLMVNKISIDDDAGLDEFSRIVAAFNEIVPVRSRIRSECREDVERIYYATDGRIGYVASLYLRAIRLVYENDACEIDIKVLESAFSRQIWLNGVDDLNPFSSRFVYRELNRPGEPFFNLNPREVVKTKGASGSRRFEL